MKTDVDQFDLCKMSEFWQSKISKSKNSEQTTMLLTRETLLEEDLLSEDFESDFERAYSRAQKEFTREVSNEKDTNYNVTLLHRSADKTYYQLVQGCYNVIIVRKSLQLSLQ